VSRGFEDRVSVVIPVYNGAATIQRAVRSVLEQQLSPVEVVVVDDGSTDDTRRILESFGDTAVRILVNDGNQGIVAALNRGVEAARAPLIARMDADDYSFPNRLMAQADAFAANPALGLLGARWEGDVPGPRPFGPAATRFILHFANKMTHSVVMFRREAFDQAGGYREGAWPAEDYDLWIRMSAQWQVRILPDIVGHVSYGPQGITKQNEQRQRWVAAQIAAQNLSLLMKEPVSTETALGILRSDFGSAAEVKLAHHLILGAAAAVRLECLERGVATNGLTEATAYMLHQMRYRTRDGRRVHTALLGLPLRHPLVALELLKERRSWLQSGGIWSENSQPAAV
jgi:hypothetical protein